jgi:tetratricopeptide (TPR) repeat protein
MRLKVLHRLADIELQSLNWRRAMQVYEKIRQLSPGDAEARTNLVDLYFRIGQAQTALAEIDNFVNYKLGRRAFNQAITFLEAMLQAHPNIPAITRQLAEVHQQAGNVELAIAQYDRAGKGFLAVGNKAAAIEAVIAILSLNPPNKREYAHLLARLQTE